MRVKDVQVQFKAGPNDGLKEGEFIVYPSTFIKKKDSYGDVVAKGAFLDDIEAWKASGNTLPGLYGHRMDDPDYFVAGAHDMGEDDHGWWVKGEFDLESPKGPQVYRLVKGRRLNQLSFAYDVEDEGEVDLGDGEKANELRKLKVYEFSFVPLGANPDTSVVAVKAATDGLLSNIKAGAEISAKNMKALQAVAEQIDAAGASIKDVLSSVNGGGKANDQEKASEQSPAKSDEEPGRAKSDEEPSSKSSVDDLLAADIQLRLRSMS